MIRFVNKLTGTLMLVAPERKAEYLAAGHRLAEPKAPDTKPPRAAPAAAKRPGKAAKKKEG